LGYRYRLRYRYRLVLDIVLFALNSIWAIPLVMLIRGIRSILLVRICGINASRIGHTVPDIAHHLLINKNRGRSELNLYFFYGPVANIHWYKMARRSSLLVFRGWLRYVHGWNRLIPGGNAHEMPSSFTDSRDVDGLFYQFDCSLPFTTEENFYCKEWLKSKGWSDDQPFVVLLVRDSEYLNSWVPNIAWDYHSYRDSDIETYLPAIEWLNDNGVWVIRMGKAMRKPLRSKSRKAIDYAFDENNSDLLDIWLFANCSGCITTTSGPDMVSAVYGKPLLCVNASPLGLLFTMFNSIWVPKNLYWEDSGLSLDLKDYLENTYLQTEEYRKAGIRIVDLTPQEILFAVEEFWGRIQGVWEEKDYEGRMQKDFWKEFVNWPLYHSFHNWKHPSSRVGASWLSSKGLGFITSKSSE
jgi:putative glycosyltransferase (TIGR04372 family)